MDVVCQTWVEFAELFVEGHHMDGRQELAAAVDQEINRRGWSQHDVVAAGGPSTTTQTMVRTTDDPVSKQTLKKLDTAFGWAPGTASELYQGKMPAFVAPLTARDPGHEFVAGGRGYSGELADASPEVLLLELTSRLSSMQNQIANLSAENARLWRKLEREGGVDEASTDPDLQPPADGGLADLARHRAEVEGNPYLQRQAARRGGPKQDTEHEGE